MKINNPNHLNYRNINYEQTQASYCNKQWFTNSTWWLSYDWNIYFSIHFNKGMLQFVVAVVVAVIVIFVVVVGIGIFVILCEPQQTFLGLALPLNFQFLGLA